MPIYFDIGINTASWSQALTGVPGVTPVVHTIIRIISPQRGPRDPFELAVVPEKSHCLTVPSCFQYSSVDVLS